MKKIALLFLILVGTLTAMADGYTYLTFETTEGAKASVPVSSLTLTINETTLTAGSQTFTLCISSETIDEATDIYDLQGHKISKEQMRKGVYIVKTKQGTHKIVIR